MYYSIDGAAEQFAGVVSDGKIRINLTTSRSGSKIISSWTLDDEVRRRYDILTSTTLGKFNSDLRVRVNYNEQCFVHYENCIYGLGTRCMESIYSRLTDIPNVTDVVNESDTYDSVYTLDGKYKIYYRDLIIYLK